MAELGNFSFAIFYDQRGAGQSRGNSAWQAEPFQTYVRDIDQLRESFGLQTVTLLGHSWGGLLAALYASEYPQRVDQVIYVNPVPLSSAGYIEFVDHRTQLVNTHKEELDAIRASEAFTRGDPATIETYYRIYFREYLARPERINQLSLTFSPAAARAYFKIYELFYRYTVAHPFDLYTKVAEGKKPSLIIACDQDIIPLRYMKRLHKSTPSAKFVLIQESGHFPYIDQPETFFRILRDFLQHPIAKRKT
jgi:proline iminopeptidase